MALLGVEGFWGPARRLQERSLPCWDGPGSSGPLLLIGCIVLTKLFFLIFVNQLYFNKKFKNEKSKK